MKRDGETGQVPEPGESRERFHGVPGSDGLLDRLGLIEAEPIERRASGFEQLHDELLQELQRSDQDGA